MILIINKSKRDARALAEMFYYMGEVAQGVTPSEALSEISSIYRAVIIMEPEGLADAEDYIARLISYARLPLFAITDSQNTKYAMLFDGILPKNTYAARIHSEVTSHAKENRLEAPGAYTLAGIDASIDLGFVEYFGRAIPCTRTEAMIIRTLIRLYPLPISSKDILKYAFRPARMPELANVRTHISVINKKWREATGRTLITLESGAGYRILTPEVIENLLTV